MNIIIQKATSNDFTLSVEEKKTLASPTYLIGFTSDSTNVEYTVIPTVVATYGAGVGNDRTEFRITEGSNDQANGSVLLGNTGLYHYIVYEQSSTTNIDPDNATGIVERGIMRLIDSETSDYVEHVITETYVEHG